MLSALIGLRYTRAKRRNHFISFISMVSIIGIMLGVCILITVLSVMNGFDKALHESILGNSSHIDIYPYVNTTKNWQELANELKKNKEINSISPVIPIQGLLASNGVNNFVAINGIVPEIEDSAINLEEKLIIGKIASLEEKSFNILLGKSLAMSLGVGIGDKVTLILPDASLTISGVLPKIKRFTVTGIFDLGYEYNHNFALINFNDAEKLSKNTGNSWQLQLRVKDLYKANKISKEIYQEFFENIFTTDWTIKNGTFFKAVKQEKIMMFVLLMFIIVVAAFNVLATLVMVVTEKEADIAILRTMGATRALIMKVFLFQGMAIASVGTLLGVITGILLATNISAIIGRIEQLLNIEFISSSVYTIDYLPSNLELSDVLLVTTFSLLISLLFTIYPAYRASKVQITEALRYE